MARRKRKPYKSKWDDETFLFSAKILKIELQNQECGKRYKNVFYCESNVKPEGRMIIHYGRTSFKVGWTLQMKGRFVNDVFLCWSYMIQNTGEEKC